MLATELAKRLFCLFLTGFALGPTGLLDPIHDLHVEGLFLCGDHLPIVHELRHPLLILRLNAEEFGVFPLRHLPHFFGALLAF